MRIFVIVFCLLTAGIQYSFAQQNNQKFSASEQEVVNLSKRNGIGCPIKMSIP